MSDARAAQQKRARRLLEFPELLALVGQHCALERGVATMESLQPCSDADACSQLWRWIEEIDRWLDQGKELELASMADLIELIGEDRERRGILDGAALAAVGGSARQLSKLLLQIRAAAEELPYTERLFASCHDPGELGAKLEWALEADGSLKDGASPQLGAFRRRVLNAERHLRDVAQESLSEAKRRGWTDAPELVLRGDRYCVAVPSNKRSQLSGIVHDRSGSGQTVYVEPAAVVEAGNQFAEARLDLAQEEARILARLNAAVGAEARELIELFEGAVELDLLRARVRWGRSHQAKLPRFDEAGELSLVAFRHPILEHTLRTEGSLESLVPLHLSLDPGDRVLLLSGPNAGGKTVALKAVGLAVLMAQSGIPLPALETPVLPRFDAVFVDLGDEQSISNSLSSFSAHVTHLRQILEALNAQSLILLDEVGGATDPLEGVALAQAILEALVQRGCRVLCSTHYGQLKSLAQELEGLRNASMAYDDVAMRPRFELLLDRPGASHALEIAQRHGLPAEVVARARELVGDEHLQFDSLLNELERERDALLSARLEAQRLREEAREHRMEYETRAAELRRERRSRLAEAETEAAGIIRNTRARLERLLEEQRNAGASELAAATAAELRAELNAREGEMERRAQARLKKDLGGDKPATIELGQSLRHRLLGSVGEVVEIRGERIGLDIRGRRVDCAAEDLLLPHADTPPSAPEEGAVRTEFGAETEGLGELDVRGFDQHEAWTLLDHALDRCLLHGRRRLELIHGKGSGILRKSLGERLRKDPRVRRVLVGGGGEFDDGLSVIELK
jgi:DNA mismatch repair protein MutS2